MKVEGFSLRKRKMRSSKKDKKVVVESFDSKVMFMLTRNFHKLLKSSKRSSRTSSAVLSKRELSAMFLL
jgi:hypothetical protein